MADFGFGIGRAPILLLWFALFASGLPGAAPAGEPQAQARTPRIGVLGTARSPATDALVQGLRDRGWVEGQNVIIEWRWAGGHPELYAEHAAELVRLKVDVILAPDSAQVEAARQATKTIPIVFALHADPVGVGHVASLSRPGGNITGVAQLLTELSAKELEILTQAVPNARRIGVLWNPAFPSHHQALKALETAGAKLDVQLHTVEAEDPDRFDEAFATLARQHVAAGLVVNSTIYLKHAERLGKLALRHRLPVMFGSTWHVHAGGFISYGPNVNTLVRRSAAYIDKILRGRKPADLPVEQAATFELAVNLKTAKALGIAVPQSILIRADEVIQ